MYQFTIHKDKSCVLHKDMLLCNFSFLVKYTINTPWFEHWTKTFCCNLFAVIFLVFLIAMSSQRHEIQCVRCNRTMLYQDYRRHLNSCQGSGRFCPICLSNINLEGQELKEHLINCQRKWLVLYFWLFSASFYYLGILKYVVFL